MHNLLALTPMLKTNNMPATVKFYTDVLGFSVNGQWPDENPQWCSLACGKASVMFYADNEHDLGDPKMTGRLCINTDDVLGLLERIKERVKVIEGPEVYFYGMKEFAIEDNNGYMLAFGQETNEPPTCPQ